MIGFGVKSKDQPWGQLVESERKIESNEKFGGRIKGKVRKSNSQLLHEDFQIKNDVGCEAKEGRNKI